MYNQQFDETSYSSQTLDTAVSNVMRMVYARMFLALMVTAFTAWYVATSNAIMGFLFSNSFAFWGILIAQLILVFTISGAINRLSTSTATLLFFIYSIVNGLMFSSILLIYPLGTIYQTFFITAAVFGAMSVYGFFTNKDLTRIGSFLFMGLIGLIIASIVNVFWANSTFDWIISFIGVAVFIGLTAWDTQKIKNMAGITDEQNRGKIAVIGALSLYLDFINLFLYLLRIFGGNRD